MECSTCGKYLVLVGDEQSPRALLFGGTFDYLAELEYDSLTVAHLVQGGRPCHPPQPLRRNRLLAQAEDRLVRCYHLGDWKTRREAEKVRNRDEVSRA